MKGTNMNDTIEIKAIDSSSAVYGHYFTPDKIHCIAVSNCLKHYKGVPADWYDAYTIYLLMLAGF